MTVSWDNGAPACFIGFGPNGVCHYRTYMPAAALQASMFVRHERELTVLKQLGVMEEPVAIYSMPFFDWQVSECAQMIDSDQRLIVDVDDYLRGMLGKDDVLQPERFTTAVIDLHEALLKKSALVTTSTQWIADTFKSKLGVECVVCPNAIDPDRFNIRRFPRRKDFTVIGWSGAAGHLTAFRDIVVPTINKVLKTRDDVLFCMIGNPAPADELIDPISLFDESIQDRCKSVNFAPIYQHASLISQFHISLAPALDDDFYRAKSPIRYLEASAAFSATIASPTTYGETITAGEQTMGEEAGIVTADNDPELWATQVLELIGDPKRRDRMSRVARKYVVNNRSIDQSVDSWRKAIERALEK